MSLILRTDHPATSRLREEGFSIAGNDGREVGPDRALRIAVLNLMPDKQGTELDLLRMLGGTTHAVEAVWIRTQTYRSRNADPEHLSRYYLTFGEIANESYDGLIITGAPVEHLAFEEVAYWEELRSLMDWATGHAHSCLFICWAAQAALYHHYGIGKYPLEKKLFGVFDHEVTDRDHPLMQGHGAVFAVPHSRYTTIRQEDVARTPGLRILAQSVEGGIHLVDAPSVNAVCMTGHPEYNLRTLENEYLRDRAKGLGTSQPANYYPDGDPSGTPEFSWQKTGSRFYANWLNHIAGI